MTIDIIDVESGIAAVSQAQSDYQASLTSAKAASLAYQASGHERVHNTVAGIYATAVALMADEAILDKVLAHYSIGRRDGTNPFFPVVKAICRKPLKGGGTEFDKSAGKYANSCRYFRDNKWPIGSIPSLLATLKLEVDGRTYGKLRATEAADRAKYRENAADAEFERIAFEHLLEQPSVLAVPNDYTFEVEGPTDGMFIAAAFSFDSASGQWAFRELLDSKSEAVARAISKKVVSAFKQEQDTFFLKLAEANDETDALNSMAPAMQRMIAAQKARRSAEEHPLPADLFEEPDVVTEGNEQHKTVLATANG